MKLENIEFRTLISVLRAGVLCGPSDNLQCADTLFYSVHVDDQRLRDRPVHPGSYFEPRKHDQSQLRSPNPWIVTEGDVRGTSSGPWFTPVRILVHFTF